MMKSFFGNGDEYPWKRIFLIFSVIEMHHHTKRIQ